MAFTGRVLHVVNGFATISSYNFPFFTSSSMKRPRPTFGILDFAILTSFGHLLGLGRLRDRFGFELLALAVATGSD